MTHLASTAISSLFEKVIKLYIHFNDQLIKPFNRFFDGIIQPVLFWDFPPFTKSFSKQLFMQILILHVVILLRVVLSCALLLVFSGLMTLESKMPCLRLAMISTKRLLTSCLRVITHCSG